MKKLITFLVVAAIFSCTNPVSPDLTEDNDTYYGTETEEKQSVTLSDSRLSGTFTYNLVWEDENGIEEINETTIITFDGTSKFKYYSKYKNYSIATGWATSPDNGDSWYRFDMEIELNSTKTQSRTRLWLYEGTEHWSAWEDYSFSGNQLTVFVYGQNTVSK